MMSAADLAALTTKLAPKRDAQNKQDCEKAAKVLAQSIQDMLTNFSNLSEKDLEDFLMKTPYQWVILSWQDDLHMVMDTLNKTPIYKQLVSAGYQFIYNVNGASFCNLTLNWVK